MSNVHTNEFIFLCPKDDVVRVYESLAFPIVKENTYLITAVKEVRSTTLITVEAIETSLSYYDWKIV